MQQLEFRAMGCTMLAAIDSDEPEDRAWLEAVRDGKVRIDNARPGARTLGYNALIRNLRDLAQYKTVPILMLTTESSDAMKSQGRSAGATGWLVKPFDPQKLIEVVRKVIG